MLYGGLGNVLFQLAAVCSLAKQRQTACIVGYWSHWNSHVSCVEVSVGCFFWSAVHTYLPTYLPAYQLTYISF